MVTENQQELLNALDGIQSELRGIKRKPIKQVIQIFVAIFLSLIIGTTCGVVCGKNWDDIMLKFAPEKYSSSTVSLIEDKLTKQAELNTGLYQQTSNYDSGDLYNSEIFEKLKINSKSMKFTFTGYVEAGIANLADAKVNVNAKTNVITIENIKVDITNVYIDPSSITDTKQSKNIFNQLKIEDFTDSQKELEQKMINDAKEKGIIEEAQENAEGTLKNLFGDITIGYDIVFNWS